MAYVNGVEVTRANTRDQENGFDSRALSHLDREAVEFENFGFPASLPGIGLGTDNVLAIHLLNSVASSNDMLLSLELVDGLIADTNAVGIPNAQMTQPAIAFLSYDQSPETGNQDEEYLELHNTTDEALDISGWALSGGVTHRFRGGTVIPGGESLYATPDSLAFRNRVTGPRGGMGLFVQDGYQGHLSSRSETVELVDPSGKVVASLTTTEEATDVQKYLRVTEVHYNPLGSEETTEFLELRNISDGTTLDLNGVRVTDGPSDPFAFSGGQVTTLAPGAFVLIVNDMDAFTEAYPDVDPGIIAGAYEGSLSNGGETIKIEDAQNGTVLEFRYEDGRDDGEENWHVVTDGDGYSLVIRNEAGPIEAWDTGMGWRPSVRIGGSPGESDGPPRDVDFDNDGDEDVDDLDLLWAGVRQADLAFDLNLDGVVDADDRHLMLSAWVPALAIRIWMACSIPATWSSFSWRVNTKTTCQAIRVGRTATGTAMVTLRLQIGSWCSRRERMSHPPSSPQVASRRPSTGFPPERSGRTWARVRFTG